MSTGALGTTKLPPGAGAKLTPILDGASLTRNPNSALEALYVRTADAGRYVFAVASGSAVAAVSLFTDRVVAERWGHGCGVAWLGARRAPLDDGATEAAAQKRTRSARRQALAASSNQGCCITSIPAQLCAAKASLTEINLSDNQFGEAGARALAAALWLCT